MRLLVDQAQLHAPCMFYHKTHPPWQGLGGLKVLQILHNRVHNFTSLLPQQLHRAPLHRR